MQQDINSLIIRPIQPLDRSFLYSLALEGHGDSVFRSVPFSVQKFNNAFDRVLDSTQPVIALVAEFQQQIIGFIYATTGEYFMGTGDHIVSVHGLYLQRSLRITLLGGKVGLKLVTALLQWAKKQSVSYVLFHVTLGQHQQSCDRFFRKLGMTTLGGNYAIKV